MASRRPAVPAAVRRKLLEESGHRCANPGCPNTLVQLHHIDEWHVYETHDASSMIAVCASCHDAIHRGALPISDDALRRWKAAPKASPAPAHVYVEPGPSNRLRLGDHLEFESSETRQMLSISESCGVGFDVSDGDIMLLRLSIPDAAGASLVRVVHGHVRAESNDIEVEQVPGHIRVTTSDNVASLFPQWVADAGEWANAGLPTDYRIPWADLPLLDIEVVEPGCVRVEGLLVAENSAAVMWFGGVTALFRGSDPKSLLGPPDGLARLRAVGGPFAMLQIGESQ